MFGIVFKKPPGVYASSRLDLEPPRHAWYLARPDGLKWLRHRKPSKDKDPGSL